MYAVLVWSAETPARNQAPPLGPPDYQLAGVIKVYPCILIKRVQCPAITTM